MNHAEHTELMCSFLSGGENLDEAQLEQAETLLATCSECSDLAAERNGETREQFDAEVNRLVARNTERLRQLQAENNVFFAALPSPPPLAPTIASNVGVMTLVAGATGASEWVLPQPFRENVGPGSVLRLFAYASESEAGAGTLNGTEYAVTDKHAAAIAKTGRIALRDGGHAGFFEIEIAVPSGDRVRSPRFLGG